MADLELLLFTTSAGACQVSDFLEELDSIPGEMGNQLVDELLTGEIRNRPKATAHLAGPIWELRWSFQKRAYRITYCTQDGMAVLFWGFEEKTEKTPKNVLDQSKRRYNEWRKGNARKQ